MASVLIIYTGGTIGMVEHPETKELTPLSFDSFYEQIPEFNQLNCQIDFTAFNPPLDSSNIIPKHWIQLVEIIEKNYSKFDGFVILHGSDTMAYSASVLSFMIQNIQKPIIFTGSQLPIGTLRTDAKENLLTAIEIASSVKNGKPIVPEVAIYFEYQLYRGNRTTKISTEAFKAFESPNYPILAQAGVHLKYNYETILKSSLEKLRISKKINTQVVIIKMFPGISENLIASLTDSKNIRAIILETYGMGNINSSEAMIKKLREAIEQNIIIVNVSQCQRGKVEQRKYETGAKLKKLGVISGKDITVEAAVTKMMFLLGNYENPDEITSLFTTPIAGELSI